MANDVYSALSDLTRRRILGALSDRPCAVGELVTELGVSQPTVSKHLKVLRDTGLVTTRAEGQKRFYSIRSAPLQGVAQWVQTLLASPEQAQPEQPAPADEAVTPGKTHDAAGEAAAESDAGHSARHAEPGAQGFAAATPSRRLPWFVTEPEAESGSTEVPETEYGVEGAEPHDVAHKSPEVSQTPENGVNSDQIVPVNEEVLQQTAEGPESMNTSVSTDAVVSSAETDVTGSNVDSDTDVTSAASRPDTAEPDDSSSAKPASGVPAARTGGAHRRQGGLLSTLTGFRRRGRSSRH